MRRNILFILVLVVLLNDVSCWRRRRRRRRRYVPPAVHGGWSSWALSGSCSKTCGGGTQQRSRACTNPRPANGGNQCPGASTSRVPCNSQHCPIKVSNAISTNGGIKYQLVSCFSNKQRRLNQLLITEQDPTKPAWNGHFVDWNNWKGYMGAFLDRCATKAKSMNLKVFGVGNYVGVEIDIWKCSSKVNLCAAAWPMQVAGRRHYFMFVVQPSDGVLLSSTLAECWGDKSVSNALSTFPIHLRDFSKCVKQDWSNCQEGALRCIGNGGGIAVYQIV